MLALHIPNNSIQSWGHRYFKSLIAIQQTIIFLVNQRFKKNSDYRQRTCQKPIFSGLLISKLRVAQASILLLSILNFRRLQAIKLFKKYKTFGSIAQKLRSAQVFLFRKKSYGFCIGYASILMLSICNFHRLQAIELFTTYKIVDQQLKN